MIKLVGKSRNPEQRRKKHNMDILRLRINGCETLEELFEVTKLVEQCWKSGEIYKYAYSCLKDAILAKEDELINDI